MIRCLVKKNCGKQYEDPKVIDTSPKRNILVTRLAAAGEKNGGQFSDVSIGSINYFLDLPLRVCTSVRVKQNRKGL